MSGAACCLLRLQAVTDADRFENVGLAMSISLSEFRADTPWQEVEPTHVELCIDDQIDGVVLRRLTTNGDDRGDLTVLLSSHYVPGETTPHVYLVTAAPGSVRA